MPKCNRHNGYYVSMHVCMHVCAEYALQGTMFFAIFIVSSASVKQLFPPRAKSSLDYATWKTLASQFGSEIDEVKTRDSFLVPPQHRAS